MAKLSKETETKFDKYIHLMLYGADKIENEENINNKIKNGVPLTLAQATLEMGGNRNSFFYYINTYPELKARYESIKELRRSKLKHIAEDNIEEALTGKADITDKEKTDFSFRFMEKTDKAYNQKLEIDQNITSLNLEMSEEEIIAKIKELTEA